MKKFLFTFIGCSSLVALAQTIPKAVLFEVGGQSASVVATFDGTKWQPTTEQIPEKKPILGSNPIIKLFTDVGQIGTGQLVGAFKDGRCGSELALSSKTVVSRMIYGLLAPWNIMPRKVLRLPLNNVVYNKIMANELAIRGIKAPVLMTQILKTDLDGDRTDEIIMVAQRPALSANYDLVGTGYALKAHDYALTIVRKLTSSGVKTFVLREAFTKKDFDSKKFSEVGGDPPFRFAQWVNGISDFNGDGRMEVLVNSVLWEGYGLEVNQWDGKGFSKMLEWGC